jgi:hypothetical protein
MPTPEQKPVCHEHTQLAREVLGIRKSLDTVQATLVAHIEGADGTRELVVAFIGKQDSLNERLVKAIDGNGEKPLPVRLERLESGVRRLQKADDKASDRGWQVLMAVLKWAVPATVALIIFTLGAFVSLHTIGAAP